MAGLQRPVRPASRLAAVMGLLAVAACTSDPIESRVVALDAVPARLVFPTVPVGVADESVVIVTNRGNAPWTPTGPPTVDGTGFTWVSGCDAPVGPGAVCEARVRYAPVGEGPASGTLTMNAPGVGAQGSDVIVTVDLAGEGGPAVLQLTPTAIAFSTVPVGDFVVEVVTAENVGDADLVFDAVATPDAFRVAGGQSARVSLAPGERRDLNVTFLPRQGGPFEGTVVAALCGPGCGPTVTLSGAGAAPRVDASPRSLDLGRVAVGTPREAVVTFENIGTGALRLEDLELIGPTDLTLAVAPDLPAILLDGETLDVTVRYAPAAGRASLGALLVARTNDPLSPEVFVPIDGTTSGPGLVVLPTAAHFGRLGDGASRDLSLIVRNVGTDDIADLRLSLEGSAFGFLTPTIAGGLRTGEALQVPVRATAGAAVVDAGGASGRLLATGDGVSAAATLAVLAGTSGCVPVATIGHANLGLVPLGTGAQGAVVIDNVGDAPCALQGFEPGGGGLGFDQDFSAAPRGLLDLAPGASGSVQFAFVATRGGQRQAVVELAFADVAAPLFVSASAEGIDGDLSTLPPRVALGPRPRACGDVLGASALVNTGPTTLTVDRVEFVPAGGPISVEVGNLPFSLLPGASRAVRVIGRTNGSPVGISEATATFHSTVGISTELRVTLEIIPDAEPVLERFTVAPVSSVDILFVVDNSGSMFDDQELLAANFARFFALGLVGGAPSFQVGVTTTDVLSPDAARGTLVGQPSILTAATSNLEQAFAVNVRVGVEGTGLELGLEAMRLALEHPDNAGFVRRDAALSIVFVTDEEDAGAFPEALPDAALSRAPEDYIALLAALKAGTVGNAPILVSGVVATGAASRYEALVRHFGGTLLDIRTADWGERLSEVGNDTFALARSFQLQSDPVDGTLSVAIDGQTTSAFTYDAGRRTVILDAPPRPGATVDVAYQSGCR